jgi:photosystem II stability/assembly factor-like uncharacterized protein
MTKIKLIAVICVFISGNMVESQWIQNTDVPCGMRGLEEFSFPTKDTGYAVGWDLVTSDDSKSIMVKTTDGGKNWECMDIIDSLVCPVGVFFINKDTGYIGGIKYNRKRESAVYMTNDGGNNWVEQNIRGDSMVLYDIVFADDTTGYIAAQLIDSVNPALKWSNGLLLKTEDGGNTWIRKYSYAGGNTYLTDICFLNKDTGFSVLGISDTSGGYSTTIFKTENGGESWNIAYNASRVLITNIEILENNTIFACGREDTSSGPYSELTGLIVKSNDGGRVWENMEVPKEIETVHKTCFIDNDTGYFIGGDWALWDGFIYKTNDGGKNWSLQETTQHGEAYFRDIIFTDSITGHVIETETDTGVPKYFYIYSTDAGGESSIILGGKGGGASAGLIDVWPNPFSTGVEIRVIKGDRAEEFRIYDISGRLITSLVTRSPSHVTWDGRDNAGRLVPGGVYVVKIRTDREKVSRRVTLLR